MSHIVKLTSQIVEKEKLNLEDASVLYAKQGIALFDAVAAGFTAKFNYSLLRPITYIRNVMGQTTWNTVIPTPQHPSYPSIAVNGSTAGITILENYVGKNYSFTDSTQKATHGSWDYPSIEAYLTDIGKSRTHSGINFKISVTEGTILGKKVAEITNRLPFKKP